MYAKKTITVKIIFLILLMMFVFNFTSCSLLKDLTQKNTRFLVHNAFGDGKEALVCQPVCGEYTGNCYCSKYNPLYYVNIDNDEFNKFYYDNLSFAVLDNDYKITECGVYEWHTVATKDEKSRLRTSSKLCIIKKTANENK